MSNGLDRQIRPIYDALDSNSPKSAIVTCNKLLKKNPDNALVKALKALALLRVQKIDECLTIVDQILPTKPVNDSVLTALMHTLRGVGRHLDVVSMFEEAYKQQPANEDLAAQVFYAHLRTYNWKVAQQIATRMYKQFQGDKYLFWSVMCSILQANSPATEPNLRTLLFKLAHRMVTSSPTPSYANADRFYLHLSILKELELWDEVDKLLTSDVGKTLCSTSLVCEELRRTIWKQRKLFQDDSIIARQRITDNHDRNWLEFLAVIDGVVSTEDSEVVTQNAAAARAFLLEISEKDGQKDRSARLALMELERQLRQKRISRPGPMVQLMTDYFMTFGDKACCFEDMKPFLELPTEEAKTWDSFLESLTLSADDTKSLQTLINVHKLRRYSLAQAHLSPTMEVERCRLYLQHYFDGLPLGDKLPTTELQPVDDLAILAGTTLVNLYATTKEQKYLHEAVCVLEYALTKSKQCFQARLILIRIYRIIGCPSLALDHYRTLNTKQVQQDTLSHFIISRGSTFSLGTAGDLTMLTECVEASQIYLSNQQETNEFIARAFQTEKYSQIPEFLIFEERLEQSLQRDLTRVEQARMRFGSEVPTSDPVDLELIELKLILERNHHDNRDIKIVPNYQPAISESLEQQTRLFKQENVAWLWAFLSTYVKIYQQSSDLDDIVEERLLVGDRPKRDRDPKVDPCLRTSFTGLDDDVLIQCTDAEKSILQYLNSLADWLGPHHDHVRPPPSVVLAEVSKNSGQSLKGLRLPENGASTPPKDRDPPPVKESPEVINTFFAGFQQRFHDALNDASPTTALHLACLAHETFLLLYIHTLRFKSSTVIKIHKLGSLAQICKTLRTDALSALQEISRGLLERAKSESASDYERTFVTACDLLAKTKVDQDFVAGMGRSIADSRKAAVETCGKGLARVHSTYSSLI